MEKRFNEDKCELVFGDTGIRFLGSEGVPTYYVKYSEVEEWEVGNMHAESRIHIWGSLVLLPFFVLMFLLLEKFFIVSLLYLGSCGILLLLAIVKKADDYTYLYIKTKGSEMKPSNRLLYEVGGAESFKYNYVCALEEGAGESIQRILEQEVGARRRRNTSAGE
jgi:hypothetical protein